MNPWNPEWRSWLYGMAMLCGGIALTLIGVWALYTVAFGPWPAGTEKQRLSILFYGIILFGGGGVITQLGLVMRTNIRQIKGTFGKASVELSSHDKAKSE